MRNNFILDVTLSDGGSFSGDPSELLDLQDTATDMQTEFVFSDLIDGTCFMFFVDGVKFTKVTTLTEPKQFKFTSATGTVEVFNGVDADVIVSAFGASSGTTLTAQDEPVTVAEAKAWLKIDVSDDDTLIGQIITASRARLERLTNISWISRTVTARLLNELGGIQLPYGPVNTVASLTDDDGNVLDSTSYTIVGGSFKAIKEVIEGEFTAVYTAGYTVLPQDMREDLLNQVAYSYENRGDLPQSSQISPLLNLSYSRNQ